VYKSYLRYKLPRGECSAHIGHSEDMKAEISTRRWMRALSVYHSLSEAKTPIRAESITNAAIARVIARHLALI
jgi:hypothetical protein